MFKKIIKKTLLKIVYPIIETLIRNISGGLGQRLRFFYYRARLKKCGTNVKIDEGVIIQNPESIELGNDVWILSYSILVGRGKHEIDPSRIVKMKNDCQPKKEPILKIGSMTAIGAYNIIHGYGGLTIADRVTTSARVSIYSFSHLPTDPDCRNKITYANSMVTDGPIACIVSPIFIGEGSWLGLGVSIFSGNIGKHCFVTANSIVNGDLKDNSYAHGNPAKKIKERFSGYDYS